MSDLYLTFDGDLKMSSNKDISLVSSPAQNDVQQIYIRLMTEPGDFHVYPQLGTALSKLYRNASRPSNSRVW
jgi:hypothetical protein